MRSYEATTWRISVAVGLLESSRRARSCAMARWYMSRAVSAVCLRAVASAKAGTAGMMHVAVTSAARIRCFIGNCLSKLRIHFVEVFLLDEHLARLAARRRRDEPVHLHHVHESRGAAEADSQPALQVRDRRLAARHDDARRFVVQLVLLELGVFLCVALFVRGDGGVVCRLALLPQEARQAGALLLGDVRPVQANE